MSTTARQQPLRLVDKAMRALCSAHPDLVCLSPDGRSVLRRTPVSGKVALLSGGGSGHEPLHAGFVGTGMLDVAVQGGVFASPAAGHIVESARAVAAGRGVLMIVKNYTGDVMNFGIAAELLRSEGIPVETVIVDDDLASGAGGDDERSPGRRGTAAVLAVEKICGAAAEKGADLAQLAELGRNVARRSATLSLAFGPCVNPETGLPAFELAHDEIEFGVGIHGERGIEQRPRADLPELARQLTEPLMTHLGLVAGDRVIAIVNGLGGTSQLALSNLQWEVEQIVADRGIVISRVSTCEFVTSLDMSGLSVTLVDVDDEHLRLWDAPVATPTYKW
jgi:dihydroxyacetone kinase-like protein